jgi:hypothetical protein
MEYPVIQFEVTKLFLPAFTSLLQYGIELKTVVGTPLGAFLRNCPGLSQEYLAETVQTIFLNGTAVDTLEKPLVGTHPIIALSAAMPGLAGAIFRKNGPHAALRTTTENLQTSDQKQGPLPVTLKLFNQIARDKGEELLARGVVIGGTALANFLTRRTELATAIRKATLQSHPAEIHQLTSLVREYSYIHVQIIAAE